MIKKHTTSIGHALNGLRWAFRTQTNYRVHTLATICTFLGGLFFAFTYVEWLIVIVMVVGGFTIETINTAIEQLGDAIDKNYNETIKTAKDLSAGAMLLYSIGAIAVAGMMFLPKIINLLVN